MNQTRLESLIEVCFNVGIGLCISIVANAIVFPAVLGVTPSLSVNILVSAIYTVISVVRGYCVRRFFNAGLHRAAAALARRLTA